MQNSPTTPNLYRLQKYQVIDKSIDWAIITHPIFRGGENMNQKEKEQVERQKNLNEFNSITQKVKPENQNQTYNVRKEGIGPVNQKR